MTAPDEGPVGAAGAGRALPLPSRVAVLDVNRMCHHLAAMLAVLAAVDSRHALTQGTARGLAQLADVLDGEALGRATRLQWAPWPGRHRLTLRDERGRPLQAVEFEVRGARVKPQALRP